MAVRHVPAIQPAPGPRRPRRTRPIRAPKHQQRLFEALAHPLSTREVAELLRALPFPGASS